VVNVCGTLQKYQYKEPLEDLPTLGMTVEDFWQDNNKDYMEFEYKMVLIPKQVHVKFSWPLKKLHESYYLACIYGLNFMEARIPRGILKTSYFDLHVKLGEMYTIYHFRLLDITMMTVWCM
jgi:hypothetical protein